VKNMNTRYRLIFRGIRGGMYYSVDKTTGKRTSLQMTNEDEARQIVEAKNTASRSASAKPANRQSLNSWNGQRHHRPDM
jgi:hypothetical protein